MKSASDSEPTTRLEVAESSVELIERRGGRRRKEVGSLEFPCARTDKSELFTNTENSSRIELVEPVHRNALSFDEAHEELLVRKIEEGGRHAD